MGQENQKEKIGEYTMENEIGHGSFADVHTVRNRRGDLFAMKIIRKFSTIYRPSDSASQLSSDVEILPKLNHKYIVKFIESFQDKGRDELCIVTELCKKGDLRGQLNSTKKMQKTYDEKAIVNWFQMISSALDYLHDENIMHRDLKPENILIGDDDSLKLADFGIAKLIGQGPDHSTVCGALAYMAPEVRNMRPYDMKCDVWSSGVILFELCSLDSNFLPKEKQIPRRYSEQLQNIVTKMLEENPRDRPDIKVVHKKVSELKNRLETHTEGGVNADSGSGLIDPTTLTDSDGKLAQGSSVDHNSDHMVATTSTLQNATIIEAERECSAKLDRDTSLSETNKVRPPSQTGSGLIDPTSLTDSDAKLTQGSSVDHNSDHMVATTSTLQNATIIGAERECSAKLDRDTFRSETNKVRLPSPIDRTSLLCGIDENRMSVRETGVRTCGNALYNPISGTIYVASSDTVLGYKWDNREEKFNKESTENRNNIQSIALAPQDKSGFDQLYISCWTKSLRNHIIRYNSCSYDRHERVDTNFTNQTCMRWVLGSDPEKETLLIHPEDERMPTESSSKRRTTIYIYVREQFLYKVDFDEKIFSVKRRLRHIGLLGSNLFLGDVNGSKLYRFELPVKETTVKSINECPIKAAGGAFATFSIPIKGEQGHQLYFLTAELYEEPSRHTLFYEHRLDSFGVASEDNSAPKQSAQSCPKTIKVKEWLHPLFVMDAHTTSPVLVAEDWEREFVLVELVNRRR